MRRRICILLLATVASTFGLIGLTATPAAAYCIEVEGVGCVWVCPPGFTCPM